MISSIQENQLNSFLKLKRRLWKDNYDKGDFSNVSDLDNHNIYSSKNELNSIEDIESVKDN